ncbi:hypothetical protein [Hymenobacter rubripertinctus]|uniref:Outer membrane protein beta-barrel domain-containing protein n=1 Tax=Hymenobacter rubripertinctus TaxID=2029981 RepID=A0A418QZ42_9BACT|nr:hypothetical protein [Hymenobacter rubripertinctus]RIY10437.1 hypothetical protein D0T11_09545 [Hymenobacter rubripertinctus]
MRFFSRSFSWLGLFLLLSFGSISGAAAQSSTEQETYESQKRLTVGVTKYAEARGAVTGFIRTRAARVQKQEETPEQLTAEFVLPTAALPALDSLVATLGFVLENNLNAHNLTARLEELAADEQRLTMQLEYTKTRLLAPQLPAEERETLVTEAANLESRLAHARQQQQRLRTHQGQTYVVLRLYDEVSFPTGNHKVAFVNMPGVEYGYLRLDNPRAGLTSKAYQGYSIKYHFTRGKSYFNLGVYKPTEKNATDSTFINELFVINFGQDFYPRNFGRGRRQFLNLYTSYQIGGFILNRNDDQKNDFIPNLNLGLGLELVKTRHILLDNKASYFIPLDKRSRDLRGLLYQASFSFVF